MGSAPTQKDIDKVHALCYVNERGLQARVAECEEALRVVVSALDGDHRKAGQDCTEGPCALCWAEGTAQTALTGKP